VEYARYESDFFSAQNENSFRFSSNQKLTSLVETEFQNGKSNETGGVINKQKVNLALKNIYDQQYKNFSFKLGHRIEKDFNLNPKLNSSFFISLYESVPQTDTILHISAGKAYKSASLYQLYSSYGNPSLQAENIFSYELGVLQGLQQLRSTLETTFFSNNLQESIEYDFTKEKYFNGGSKRNYGIENILESKWNSQIKSRLSYTWTRTQSLRVAEHKGLLSLNYSFSPKINLNQEAIFIGHKKDIDAVDYSVKVMKPYWLFNSHLEYKIKENLLARFHIENILNTKYEEIDGFGSPGLYTKLSFRYSF
jgi:outer membrane cobalamin receptor